ncbi:MAG: hypothetical protein JKY47_05155 [Thalassospira sp.]|nr:hypothetical protein [Thalassospira sp.]
MAEPAGTTGASWRAVVEASTDALWLLDADGTTVWANRRDRVKFCSMVMIHSPLSAQPLRCRITVHEITVFPD